MLDLLLADVAGGLIGNLILAAHLLTAAIITVGGPLQLIPQHRSRALPLHRWMGRRSLRIDTATGGREDDPRKLRELAPIATPDACDALAAHLLPGAAWPPAPAQWKGLPRRAWWRLFAASVPWNLLLAAVLSWYLGAWALLVLL